MGRAIECWRQTWRLPGVSTKPATSPAIAMPRKRRRYGSFAPCVSSSRTRLWSAICRPSGWSALLSRQSTADNDTMLMHPYSIQNPVFLVYMIAAAIMILKLMGQGWMTVYRMIKSDSGLLNPEDLTPGPANRNPRPQQLELNEYVDRSRRIQRNDLESIPAFLAIGL